MQAGKINGAIAELGAPPNWDHSKGSCGGLWVKDTTVAGHPAFESIWYPTEEELKWLNAGQPVRLTVVSMVHPPVAVGVGDYA